MSNYQGPGSYQHYKGGLYIVFGLQKLEYNEKTLVAYMTLDRDHQRDNWYDGFFSIGRPLNEEDGPDCWNSNVWVDTGGHPEPDQTCLGDGWISRGSSGGDSPIGCEGCHNCTDAFHETPRFKKVA